MSARGLFTLIALGSAIACGGNSEAEANAAPSPVNVATTATPPDPCTLITRAEAEATLGTLAADPYRSRRDTTVADANGPTCTYPTANAKTFLITPEWTLGKMMIDVDRMVGGLVRLVTDLPGVNADTLEGAWDDAVVGVTGELVLRKGTRSITLSYLGSSTDAPGALRLAAPALQRLAAVPEPPRPAVSADGCPLGPAQVSSLLGLEVRLAPRPVKLIDACSYTLADDPTVELELSIKPEAVADMVVEALHQRVRALRGANASPDSLPLGDGGWAYGSESGSEAAARARGNVYHARMTYPLSTTTPNLKAEMARLVAAMMQ